VEYAGGVRSVRTETGTAVDGQGGEVGALLSLLNTEVPNLRAQLDTIARALVHSVNQLHAQGVSGVDANGDPVKGVQFFDDQGDLATVTARNIRLSDAITADPARIAVGTGGASTNDVALTLAQLRHTPYSALAALVSADPTVPAEADLGNRTLGAYYSDMVSALGLAVASAEDTATVHETLGFQAEIRRESVSGVSTDEEMVRLIQSQAAYGAAARVITTVDEMLQTLLRL
jgi:flagellar hook-associated protein 1 FlgK